MFTKQDLLTFGIGLAVAVLFEVGDALTASEALFTSAGDWIKSLGIGVSAAAGRWIVTFLSLRGFKRGGTAAPIQH